MTVEFPRGQFAAVMGSSGSGKSTLMHVLAGLDPRPPARSRSALSDVSGLDGQGADPPPARAIGFVFQFFNLLPTLTAAENIELPRVSPATAPTPDAMAETVIDTVGLGNG